MPALTLWLCSWNIENAKPDDNQLRPLSNRVNNFGPDIVVLGLQEAGSGKKTIGRFGRLLQNYGEPQIRATMHGMTKGTVNSQAIGVFVKNTMRDSFALINDGHHSGGAEGKGGLVVIFDYDDGNSHCRIASTTCHLDSKDQNSAAARSATWRVRSRGSTMTHTIEPG